MQINLKTVNDVRVFAITISLVALLSNAVLQYLILPYALFQQVIFSGSLVSLIVATPIAYFVGMKMQDNYLLTVQLEHAVNNDKLTGANTRINFYQRLERAGDEPMVLIFADIDHFKGINDKYGHKVGDKALQIFARALMDNTRGGDIVARFGGEEFIILLCNTKLKDGVVVAQRICAKIRELFMSIETSTIQITASFGVAEVTMPAEIDDAIHMADLAVFRAKREGRDRVCVFDPVLDRDAAFSFVAV